MADNFCVTPEQSQSRWYGYALTEELRSNPSEEALARCPINHPAILEYKGRILGGRKEVEEFADWTEFLVREYAPRRRCMSLGSGIGRVERYLIRRGFTERFESIELNPAANRSARALDGRVQARDGDLNFVRLPASTYDFILCHGSLHHLINLEHVLHEVNQALKPDGILLIYEYVGENRWQFTPERLAKLCQWFPGVELRSPPYWEVTGFESVRSQDLLGLIQSQFGDSAVHSVSFGGVYFPMVTCNYPAAKRCMERVIVLDEQASREGDLPPCYHMGVYRRSGRSAPEARPWTDAELRARLAPHVPIPARCRRGLRRCVAEARRLVALRTRVGRLFRRISGAAGEKSCS